MSKFSDLVAQSLAGAVPNLVRISSEYGDMENPIFLTDNNEPITWNGNTYLPCFFKVEMPQNTESSEGTATLTISNIDRVIIREIRTIFNPLLIEFEAVVYKIADDSGNVINPPEIYDIDYWAGELQDVSCDAHSIVATIGNRNILVYTLSEKGNNFNVPALA